MASSEWRVPTRYSPLPIRRSQILRFCNDHGPCACMAGSHVSAGGNMPVWRTDHVIYRFGKYRWRPFKCWRRLAQRGRGTTACVRSRSAAGTVSRRADTAVFWLPDRSRGAVGAGDPGLPLHRRIRPDYAWARLGAVLAGLAGHDRLGHRLLRLLLRWTAFGDGGHARDGSGTAHLVWRARLLRARRHPRGAVLGVDLVPVAAGAAGRPVQPPPPAAA